MPSSKGQKQNACAKPRISRHEHLSDDSQDTRVDLDSAVSGNFLMSALLCQQDETRQSETHCKVCETLSDQLNEIQCDLYNQKAGTRTLVDEMLQEINSIKTTSKKISNSFNTALIHTVESAVHDYMCKQTSTLTQTISELDKSMQSFIKQMPSTMQKQITQFKKLETELHDQEKTLADLKSLTGLEKDTNAIDYLKVELHNLKKTILAKIDMVQSVQTDFINFQHKSSARFDGISKLLDEKQTQISMLESKIEDQCHTIDKLENKSLLKDEHLQHFEKKFKSQDAKIKILQQNINKLITVVKSNRKLKQDSQSVPNSTKNQQNESSKNDETVPTKELIIRESKFTAYSNKKQLPQPKQKNSKKNDCSRIVLKYKVDKQKKTMSPSTKAAKPAGLFDIPN